MAENMTNELATTDFLFDPNSNIGPNSTLNGSSKVWRSGLRIFWPLGWTEWGGRTGLGTFSAEIGICYFLEF
jgi:hypothetical protein